MSTLLMALAIVATEGPAPRIPPIGSPVADLAMIDERGAVRRLGEWSRSRLVVFAFVGAGCPVAELYAGRLAELADEFEPRGVAFVGVAPGRRESPLRLARFAEEHGIRFPILRDNGEAANRLGARRTPEVVVLDEDRRIRYRGRIDDQYAVGSRRSTPDREDLRESLDDLLAGRSVSRPEVEAVGCPIDRTAIRSSPVAPTYRHDVAPILARRCVGCHRPGQIGPFAITSYRAASGWADAVAEAVEEGRMPPWFADPRYGRFANDCRLTDLEKKTLLDWVRGGAPEGEPADPSPPVPASDGWNIPGPDLVLSMPTPFSVPARGVVDYQYFEVDPGFREDCWIRGAEIRPGNRRVVHHCNVFLKAPGSRNDIDTAGELGSYCLAAMTPGAPPFLLPDGMAKRIPAGWRLVFVVHYQPVGTVQTDRTRIGLVLADRASVRKEVATNLLFDPDLLIPPHAADHRIERSRRFDEDVLLLAMFPHMHLRGRSFRFEAIYPDGRDEILLDVPRYDFNWQNRYVFAEPKRLPAGSVLRCVAHFDNSEDNPANPDPNATVRAGKQSADEMFNGYYDIVLADQDLTRPWSGVARRLRRSNGVCLPMILMAGASALVLVRWRQGGRSGSVTEKIDERA